MNRLLSCIFFVIYDKKMRAMNCTKSLPSRLCSDETASRLKIQALFEIVEGLLHQVLVPVDLKRLQRVFYLIAQKGKVAVIAFRLRKSLFLGKNLRAASRRTFHLEVSGILLLMIRMALSAFQLFLQGSSRLLKALSSSSARSGE